MANRILSIAEVAADFDRMVKESGIDPKEFALVIAYAYAYAYACAYDEDEQHQVRVLMGLEGVNG